MIKKLFIPSYTDEISISFEIKLCTKEVIEKPLFLLLAEMEISFVGLSTMLLLTFQDVYTADTNSSENWYLQAIIYCVL